MVARRAVEAIAARLAGLPAPAEVGRGELDRALADGPTVVVLDDDPTGTQTVRQVPVLTRWRRADIAWALGQETAGFFVVTNTRSLPAAAAAARNDEVVRTCLDVAAGLGRSLAFASRGDSTLRGHFPLEPDAIAAALRARGGRVDGVVLAPAYVDAGRITLDGVHLLRVPGGFGPVAESEFAADPTFGFRSARLADWVAEKSRGRIPAASVVTIGIEEVRTAGRTALAAAITALADGQVLSADAVEDADLRALALAVLDAERAGRTVIYRVGPSFVRARLGQVRSAPVADGEVDPVRPGRHGLVVVGSHVGLTSRQLACLLDGRACAVFELDVDRVLGSDEPFVDESLAAAAGAELAHRTVVVHTSRGLRSHPDPEESLRIARRVGSALTGVVRRIVEGGVPAYVVAKGGITSSTIATDALGIGRAWARGCVLPGIVSLWEAADGPYRGLPYVVFAGNVGTDTALLDVVERLDAIVGVEVGGGGVVGSTGPEGGGDRA